MFSISIIGLGLMGGSFAYALRGFKKALITGYDINPEVTAQAYAQGAIDIAAHSAEEAVANSDLCIFCAAPGAILAGIEACKGLFKPGSVVSEICGVKREMAQCIPLMLPDGVCYVGLHPMAGKEVGGFVNADVRLFQGAGFIIVPPHNDRGDVLTNARENTVESAITLLRDVSLYVGAGRVIINTPEEHDNIIAYSSDLPHMAAAALVAHYPEGLTLAHTAGAFRDCTRIADMDAKLWTSLLMANRESILPHLDAYRQSLSEMSEALRQSDTARLYELLSAAGNNKRRLKSL